MVRSIVEKITHPFRRFKSWKGDLTVWCKRLLSRSSEDEWIEIPCQVYHKQEIWEDAGTIEFYGGPFDGMRRVLTEQDDAAIAIPVDAHAIDEENVDRISGQPSPTSFAIYTLDDSGSRYGFVTTIEAPPYTEAWEELRIFARRTKGSHFFGH
jgi:molybdopterin-guanine dinucleotide biosynthesis protein A